MALSRRGGLRTRRRNRSKKGGSSCMCGDHSAGKHSHKHSRKSNRKKSKSSSKKKKRRKVRKSKKGGFIRDRSVQMFVRSSGKRS